MVPAAPRRTENSARTLMSSSSSLLPTPKMKCLMASTGYVAGSIDVRAESHAGRLSSGNSAPERKNSGNTTTKLAISWNLSRLYTRLPIVSPREVRINDRSRSLEMLYTTDNKV